MNIGIFTDTFFPQISGVATSIKTMEKELTKRGHNVYIFTTSDPQADLEAERGKVFRFSSIPFVFFPERRIAMAGTQKVARLIKRLEIDVIHTHTEFSMGLIGKKMAKKFDLPVLHTYHTMYEDYLHYIGKGKLIGQGVVQKLSRAFCDSMDTVIVPTEKVQTSLRSYGIANHIRIIPTGTEFKSFEPDRFKQADLAQTKADLGILPDDKVVVSVGRVAQEKGIDIIVRAFPSVLAKVPNAKLLIVGDGPARAELEELAFTEDISKSVIFAGEQDWETIGRFYQLGDVFVSASTSETQGMTYIEAMASGIPVIAKADRSNENLILNRKTGRSFRADWELPEVMCDMLQQPEVAERLAANALQHIGSFSAERFGANIEQIYMEVCENYGWVDGQRTYEPLDQYTVSNYVLSIPSAVLQKREKKVRKYHE
ncbi:glycosyltransferase family 4 protein [Listeria sp. SHR_NRA_18]|uniref:glycosyltransferase family 4 protein n=1 Tax=Listeria sp. SHR_NRA_18 TaxID=2269046 RepID=UPI00051D91A2|nr:glycosyltransferase family 4 protein [Listeria sp. SHR_NRA_18]KGL39642.1 1,2-diacylglycerol 3-glucosyltransferase [Listeriaceae bacterium FSL A5-0209]RQW67185.1 glycosyltransferase family 4 protein [Listeria sp. SHR_NRA_18]